MLEAGRASSLPSGEGWGGVIARSARLAIEPSISLPLRGITPPQASPEGREPRPVKPAYDAARTGSGSSARNTSMTARRIAAWRLGWVTLVPNRSVT